MHGIPIAQRLVHSLFHMWYSLDLREPNFYAVNLGQDAVELHDHAVQLVCAGPAGFAI